MKIFLLVDDHALVRLGIKGLLSQIFKHSDIHEAGDGDSVLEKLKSHQYDLVMMDIKMPKTDTLGLMEFIHVKYPDTKVLIFSMNTEHIYAKRFLKAGVRGFLSKEAPLEEIKRAINLVLNGRKYISESLAQVLANETLSENSANPFDKLSAREFEIIFLLLSGQTAIEISKSLNLQASTIGSHKARVFEKLGITNILELKELANSYGI